MGAFGLILYTVSRNRFVLSGISDMFFIKTLDPDLIKNIDDHVEEDKKVEPKATLGLANVEPKSPVGKLNLGTLSL